jgi:excalibur calcium-binding domain-containing protein
MKNVILLALMVSLGWYGYSQYQRRANIPAAIEASTAPQSAPESQFKCDGRTYCSQMTSCAEATYFLRNCPNTKMDGNNDGIPCEKQWCK